MSMTLSILPRFFYKQETWDNWKDQVIGHNNHQRFKMAWEHKIYCEESKPKDEIVTQILKVHKKQSTLNPYL